MMTTKFAKRYAPCSKTMAASSTPMQAARRFLTRFHPDKSACLLIDAYLPGMSGLELLEKLRDEGHQLAGDHDHRQRRCADGCSCDESGRVGFHRKADRPRGTPRKYRASSRTVAHDSDKLMEWRANSSGSPRGAHAATTRRHGAGVRRAAQQEHCGRSRHQSAYGREPPRLDHEENRVEVVAGAGEIGVSCLGWRGATSERPIRGVRA